MKKTGLNDKKIVIAVAREDTKREDVLDSLRCKDSVEQAIKNIGFLTQIFYLDKKSFLNKQQIGKKLQSMNPFCVFNIFEGTCDDSHKEIEFVKILEQTDFSFTGNSSMVLENCFNKNKTKFILAKNSIPVPKGIFVKDLAKVDAVRLELPLFIKPCFEDASLGIDKKSLVTSKVDMRKALKSKIKQFPQGLIVEEFIEGKEYNVGMMGNSSFEVLGISILDYSRHKGLVPFLNYSSKWDKHCKEFKELLPSLNAQTNKFLREKIIELSLKAGKALGCKGYFRVDLREKEGNLFVLDVNPNPDINEDSGFMKQAYSKGYKYQDIVEKIITYACPLSGY